MRRREFITLIAGSAFASPVIARAQQKTIPVIGFLSSASPGPFASFVAAFRQGLREPAMSRGKT
jgi:putative ABC transport system substrate-binding protein